MQVFPTLSESYSHHQGANGFYDLKLNEESSDGCPGHTVASYYSMEIYWYGGGDDRYRRVYIRAECLAGDTGRRGSRSYGNPGTRNERPPGDLCLGKSSRNFAIQSIFSV